ncbi:Triacylglycerol lipase [Brevibacillus laterosporus]|nr:Triacylglycerol lipase [Brevibacillus laterosporus]
MKKTLLFLVISLMICACMKPLPVVNAEELSENNNNRPIILVNGFLGWGREEILGFKYWGGLHDIQEKLKKDGYQVFTSEIGPISSNWDRACELYAQINGGTVDYGAAHADEHGHARFGRTYEGFVLNWNENNKVHLVGHSMGGQTARTLVQLLKEGNREEKEYANQHSEVEISPLFEGGKSFVRSVTTIATPHNGTTLADGISTFIPFAKELLVATAFFVHSSDLIFYDFKLDQWGIKKNKGESFLNYSKRVWNSSIWKETKDTSQWDLSTDGAKELNSWVKAQPDVFYFSYSASATKAGILTGVHIPTLTMNKALMGNALFMGSYIRNEQNRPIIDASWWENDGVINTISMMGPSTDEIVSYNQIAQIGKWNYLGKKVDWDHLDLIGLSISDTFGFSDITAFYRGIAEMVTALPE